MKLMTNTDTPMINLDADETLFNHHLYNNPQVAFYAAILIDRINNGNTDDKENYRKLFRDLFFKAPERLETVLQNAQQEMNAHVTIVSYSQESEDVNYEISKYKNNSTHQQVKERFKDNPERFDQYMVNFNKKINDLENSIKPTDDEKAKDRKLNGPDFLRRSFETAFPNVRLSAVSSSLPPQGEQETVGKTNHIKNNIKVIYEVPDDKVTEIYKEIMRSGNCTLIDDSITNIRVFNKQARNHGGKSIAIQVDLEDDNKHVGKLKNWVNDKVKIKQNNKFVEEESSQSSSSYTDESSSETEDENTEITTLGDIDKLLNDSEKTRRLKNAVKHLAELNGETSKNDEERNRVILNEIMSRMHVVKTEQMPYTSFNSVIQTVITAPSEAMRGTEFGEGFGRLFGGGGHVATSHGIPTANEETVLKSINEQLNEPENGDKKFLERKQEEKNQEAQQKNQIIQNLEQQLKQNPELLNTLIKQIQKMEKRMREQIHNQVYRTVNTDKKNGVEEANTPRKRHNMRVKMRRQLRQMVDEQGLTKQIEKITKDDNQLSPEDLVKLLQNSSLVTPDVLRYYIGKLQDNIIREKFFSEGDYSSRNSHLEQLIKNEEMIIAANPNSEDAKIAQDRINLYEYLFSYNVSADEIGDISFISMNNQVGDFDQHFFDAMDNLHISMTNPQLAQQQFEERLNQAKNAKENFSSEQEVRIVEEQILILPSIESPPLTIEITEETRQSLQLHVGDVMLEEIEHIQLHLENLENNPEQLNGQLHELVEEVRVIQSQLGNLKQIPEKLKLELQVQEFIEEVENINLSMHEAPQLIQEIERIELMLFEIHESIEEVERIELQISNVSEYDEENYSEKQPTTSFNKWIDLNNQHEHLSERSITNNNNLSGILKTLVEVHNGNSSDFDQSSPTAVQVPVGVGQFIEYLRYKDRLEFKIPENLAQDDSIRKLYSKENINKVYQAMAKDAYQSFASINVIGKGEPSEKIFCYAKGLEIVEQDNPHENHNQRGQIHQKDIKINNSDGVTISRKYLIQQYTNELREQNDKNVNNQDVSQRRYGQNNQ